MGQFSDESGFGAIHVVDRNAVFVGVSDVGAALLVEVDIMSTGLVILAEGGDEP